MIARYLRRFRRNPEGRERGQSLVEIALFAPIFLIMLSGVIEVGQYTVVSNQISTAGRAAARFGANGGENDGMVAVIRNSAAETPRVDTENTALWDVWAIRGRINEAGDAFEVDQWSFEHIYGENLTYDPGPPSDVDELAIQAEILADLKEEGRDVSGLRIVASLIFYQADSLLGIDNRWATPYRVRSLKVLRITGLNLEQSNGCTAFPLAVDPLTVSDAVPGSFAYPTGRIPLATDFPLNNFLGTPFASGREGFIYNLQGAEYKWLFWNNERGRTVESVRESLIWPGNSNNYATVPRQGYIEQDSVPEDTTLHIGNRIIPASISLGDVQASLNDFIDKGRVMRVIVWDETDPNLIGGFAVLRVHGYGSGIMTELIRHDTSCGQVIAPAEE
ncbi:MAG: TadE/TadG family type IV pilus assembly protein [Chloroflexota bacterium]